MSTVSLRMGWVVLVLGMWCLGFSSPADADEAITGQKLLLRRSERGSSLTFVSRFPMYLPSPASSDDPRIAGCKSTSKVSAVKPPRSQFHRAARGGR